MIGSQHERTQPQPLGSTVGGCPRCGGLYTGITVTTAADGRVHASVELRGTICGDAAVHCLRAIDDLHALGVTDVNIDLSHTAPCDW